MTPSGRSQNKVWRCVSENYTAVLGQGKGARQRKGGSLYQTSIKRNARNLVLIEVGQGRKHSPRILCRNHTPATRRLFIRRTKMI